MKTSAKKEDYVEYIERAIKQAEEDGKEYIDLNAKNLHSEISSTPTMPTCCMAMKGIMRENDQVLSQPNTKSGFGNELTIRYFVKNRDEKVLMFPGKKRGRPKGAVNVEKPKQNKHHQKVTDLTYALTQWMNDIQISYERRNDSYILDGINGKWLVKVIDDKKGKHISLMQALYEIFNLHSDEFEKYSLFMRSGPVLSKEWAQLPDSFKNRINISLITCSEKGRVKEIL